MPLYADDMVVFLSPIDLRRIPRPLGSYLSVFEEATTGIYKFNLVRICNSARFSSNSDDFVDNSVISVVKCGFFQL
jgi:hypothetical protein